MSRKELTLMRRAYLLGLRRGLNRAQATMQSKVDCWEAEIVALQDEFQALVDDVRAARDEQQAVQQAANERAMYPDAFLN